MSRSFIIALLVLLVAAVAAAAYYLRARRRRRSERISDILSGADLLARWDYTPAEWRKAAEEEFTWARGKDSAGHIFISPTTIYIKDDSGDRLIDLSEGGKVVTYASYAGANTDMSLLKLRVRWKVVYEYTDRADEVKYFKEDYRVPVPLRHREEARRVADFFTARLENNLEAYTAVVPGDEPISLFGKDSF